MSSTFILSLVLATAPPNSLDVASSTTTVTDEVNAVDVLSANQIRAEFRQSIRRSSTRANMSIAKTVPNLVEAFRNVSKTKELSHKEQTRMLLALKARMVKMRGRLVRDLSRLKNPRRTSQEISNAGGAANTLEIQNLIVLIQNTIEPNSWDPNGIGGGLGQLAGGSAGGFGGGGGTSRTNDLVDLIKESTTMESWDINGGEGTISVFAF